MRGLVEAVTWSFISHPAAALFGGGKPELVLANPIAAELSDMRPSLVPGLVAAAQKNADRGYPDVALFEVGQIFLGDRPQDQVTAAGGVRRRLAKASGAGRHWASGGRGVDAYDAKADALAVLAAAGAPMQALQVVPGGPSWLHPGRSGTIQIGPQNVLGHFGELHPKALEALGADGPLVAFEVVLERIPEAKAKATRAKPALELAPFQPVERDFAFIVDRAVKAADIVRAAQGVDRKLIAGIAVFDVYEGPGIDRRQEVDRHRGHPAAAREDHDRPGDRRRRRQDRGRGRQAHRRRVAGVAGRPGAVIPGRATSSREPGIQVSGLARSAARRPRIPGSLPVARAPGMTRALYRRRRRDSGACRRGLGRRLGDGADLPQRLLGGAVARGPGAADRAPQRLVDRFAREPDAVAQRLGEHDARGLAAGSGGREGAERPRLLVPLGGVGPLDRLLDVGAVEAGEPFQRKGDHGRLALGGDLAAELAADIDGAQRRSRDVGEDGRGAGGARFLEHHLVALQGERIARQFQGDVVVAAEREPFEGILVPPRQFRFELDPVVEEHAGRRGHDDRSRRHACRAPS